MEDSTGRYALGWTVTTGGWLAMAAYSQPLWVGLPIMAVGVGLLINGRAHRKSVLRQRWDEIQDGVYHRAVVDFRDAAEEAYAGHRGVPCGQAWDELKADVFLNPTRVIGFIQHVPSLEGRDAMYTAASQMQGAYRAFDEALGRFWDRRAFRKWCDDSWGNHDEILILWMLIEKQRNPRTTFSRQRRLIRYRGVDATVRQLGRGSAAPPSREDESEGRET